MSGQERSILDVEQNFRSWLIRDKKLSVKAAGDVISRCKRVEQSLDVHLIGRFESNESFSALMRAISDFCKLDCQTSEKACNRANALRHAVRKLLEFHCPDKARQFKKFRY